MNIWRSHSGTNKLTILPLKYYDLKGTTMLILLLLLGLVLSSEQTPQQRRIQGGVGRDTTFYCNSGQCTWYYGGPSGSASINPGTLSGVSYVYDTLTIEDVVAGHEGVYRCEYNGEQDIFNLTVVAVPTFVGCTPQSHCNPDTTLHFSEDLDITLNISIQYVNGGARGVKQGIKYMRFKNSSNGVSLIRCDQSSCTGNSRVGSYSQDSWNLTFNVSNVTIYDTSTYYAEADLIDPNDHNSISTITSTININVTMTKGPSSTSFIQPISSTLITSTPITTEIPSSSLSSSPSSTVTTSTLSTSINSLVPTPSTFSSSISSSLVTSSSVLTSTSSIYLPTLSTEPTDGGLDPNVDDFEKLYLPALAVLLSIIILIALIGICVCCLFIGRRCGNESEKMKKQPMGTTTLNNGPVLASAPPLPPQEPVIYMQIGAPTNTTTTIYCESKHYDYIRPDPDWRLSPQYNSTSTYV